MLVTALAVSGCAHISAMYDSVMGPDWTTLIDGERGLENFNRVGDANWRAAGGAIVADKGKGGHLVTKKSYKDFQIYAEYWADATTNSGIFIRASDPNKIDAKNAYEVKPIVYPAGGKWNTFLIRAKGPHITVEFNSIKTVDTEHDQFKEGPFTLQFGNPDKEPGVAIKWRKVLVKEL